MGKGFENYMSKKWFHPTNIDNQKRLYEAQQKSAAEKKRQQELRDQYEREQEVFSNQQLMGDEKAKLGLAFMYSAPGLLKDQKEKDRDKEIDQKIEAIKTERPISVRCLKCKRFGHVNTDKSCPLYGKSRLDEEHQQAFADFERKESERQKKEEARTLAAEEAAAAQKKHLEETDGADITLDMLRALSKKEKKKIIKRLVRLEEKAAAKKR